MTKKIPKVVLGRKLQIMRAEIDGMAESPGTEPRKSLAGERLVPISKVRANPDQPRRRFDQSELQELASSILAKGIIQPLIVRPDPYRDGEFQIVAGERRWRAAQTVKVDHIPVVVRDLDDMEVLEIAIIENIQRTDLNPVDEANGYLQLMEKFGHTQEQLSDALGKSRSYLANSMRLLSLPRGVQEMLAEGKLSTGHARALIPVENAMSLARKIVEKGLSVRQTETLVKQVKEPPKPTRVGAKKDSDTVSLEADLSANLRMRVNISHIPGAKNGTVTISYKTFDDLDTLCQLLSATRSAGSV